MGSGPATGTSVGQVMGQDRQRCQQGTGPADMGKRVAAEIDYKELAGQLVVSVAPACQPREGPEELEGQPSGRPCQVGQVFAQPATVGLNLFERHQGRFDRLERKVG